MPETNPAALEFLAKRRSRPAKTLTAPVPTREELSDILTLAARSPDHGGLVPWRFIVLEKPALDRLSAAVMEYGTDMGVDPEKVAKVSNTFATANLAVAVVSSPVVSEKAPPIEQLLSAGAVCLSLVNAALASGWGASWITGWAAHDAGFVQKHLGLREGEQVAGLIHIGTAAGVPPERPRPDVAAITTWL